MSSTGGSAAPDGLGWRFLAQLRRSVPAGIAALTLLGALVASVLAWLIPALDPTLTALDERLRPPLTQGHLFGTDQLGRDVLGRLLAGTRLSLAVAVVGVTLSGSVGSLIGLVAAYRGGLVDALLSRGIDVLMAFPYLLLALCIVAVLGPGLVNATLAIAIVNVPFFARTVRAQALVVASEPYVAAARVGGQRTAAILFREILPGVLPVLAVAATTSAGWMIVETAGLSFLGLGAQPPTADLGGMLGQSRHLLTTAPHVCLIPGVTIVALVMALNVLGDAARDAFDRVRAPVQRSSGPSAPADGLAGEDSAGLPAKNERSLPALLEVRDLQIAFGREQVVSNVSLCLDAGETLGLVGESGSGKSVTAKAVYGSLPQATIRAQRLHLGGTALLETDAPFRGRHIGWVPQDPLGSLHPLQTIVRQLTDCMGLFERERSGQRWSAGAKRQAAARALAAVGIRDPLRVLDSLPHQLSGGMRQRVAIALALVGEPRLVIADEPTTALDVTTQAMVLELLLDVTRERAAALLFISHDLAVVRRLCERVVVMRDGVVVEQGETSALLRAPRHEYTRRLIDCASVVSEDLEPATAVSGSDVGEVVPAVLEVREVSRRFELGHFVRRRGVQALAGVSLRIGAGERLGLIGESGSGKSSLVKLLLGLDQPTVGAVQFRGQPLGSFNAEQRRAFRRAVQLVFQDPLASLNPRRTVRLSLDAPLRALTDLDQAARRRRIHELLELVQLPAELAERLPSELSGGQAQRVAIARALGPEPELLILDEAVSSLDVCVRAEILTLLGSLSERLGLAYLFVAHDLAVVDAICSDVLVMFAGRIVERGPVSRVLHQPSHSHTRSLIAATPRLDT